MKSINSLVALWLLAWTMGAQTAVACIAPDFERYVLFKKMPETHKSITFKSRVRVEHIARVPDGTVTPGGEKIVPGYPPTLRAELLILSSETHPELATQLVTMDYKFTSCGPHLAEGLSGYLVGNLTNNQGESTIPKIDPTMAIGSLKYYPVFPR